MGGHVPGSPHPAAAAAAAAAADTDRRIRRRIQADRRIGGSADQTTDPGGSADRGIRRTQPERMNSPRERRKIRLRGLVTAGPVHRSGHENSESRFLGRARGSSREAGCGAALPRNDDPGVSPSCGDNPGVVATPSVTLRGAGRAAPRGLRGFPLFQPRVHPPGTKPAGDAPFTPSPLHPFTYCGRPPSFFASSTSRTRASWISV